MLVVEMLVELVVGFGVLVMLVEAAVDDVVGNGSATSVRFAHEVVASSAAAPQTAAHRGVIG
ncbi:MAG: hypothetical protein AB7Q42_25110 [Acidimicrobiia bacterium]